MKKHKVIIDTDPGIDDANALILSFFDPKLDIKLFTISHGNCPLKNAARNMCHLLDLFGQEYPVVVGYDERLSGNTEEAIHMHTVEGLGGYHPPKQTRTQPLEKDCAEAMYEVIKKYPHEIEVIILGPHTNFAQLLVKHPDVKELLKGVVMMGGAPTGLKTDPNHISFNVRADIDAFRITLNSGIKITMCPSSIGREGGYYTESQVEALRNRSEVGKFLATCFSTYYEPNYPDKRIAVNDISAIYSLIYPRLFKTRRADIELGEHGETKPHYNRNGQFKIVTAVDRAAFQKVMFENLYKLDSFTPKVENF